MSAEQLLDIADRAGVHPAIVAGRWRYEHGDYRRFGRFLGGMRRYCSTKVTLLISLTLVMPARIFANTGANAFSAASRTVT